MTSMFRYIVLFAVMFSLVSTSQANQCIGFYGANESRLSLAPRIKQAELLLERKLEPHQIEAIWTAHYIGLNEKGKNGKPAELGNFTKSQIARKITVLRAAKFETREIHLLLDKGITGFHLFFEVYGVIGLARDLWKLFTYNPAKPDDYVQQFSAPLENGKVRPPEKAFEDVFADHFKIYNNPLAPVYPILESNLGYNYSRLATSRIPIPSVDVSFFQSEANKESKRLAKAYAENVQMALLVKTNGDKQELVMGSVEPVAGVLDGINITTDVRVHTTDGVKTIAVKDIVRSTNADLRNRFSTFAKVFEVFKPVAPENFKDKVGRISDLLNSDLNFWKNKAGEEISAFKKKAQANEYVGFLVKDSAGNHRLVIGKVVATEIEIFTKEFDTVQYKANPNKTRFWHADTVGVQAKREDETSIIGKFIVETENGKEVISRDNVVSYTTIDLRDRTELFMKEFREFGYVKPSDYDAVAMMKKNMTDQTTMAFLVKENDGAQKLVVGSLQKVDGEGRSLVSAEIKTPNNQTLTVDGSHLLMMTKSSIRSYVGLDMPLLQKAFASIPSQKMESADSAAGSKMVIKDAAAHLSDKDQAKAASNLSTAQKASYVESLLGRKLEPEGNQMEGLLQAIFARAVPLTRAELMAGIQKPITLDDLDLKKSYLKLAGFSESEISRIVDSGVLGVLE